MTSPTASVSPAATQQRAQSFMEKYARLKSEIAKVVVGQDAVVESTLIAILSGGHALLEGVPGLGKTLLVRTLSQAMHLRFNRIQFTPDLMPADITGTNVVLEDAAGRRGFSFQAGPVFANIVLADEINRATPKTQSALLEAMQEHSVTVAGTIHRLEEPFFVLATQNPIEQEGTYPLPEAQLDRFLFKILVPQPTLDELGSIVDRTTGVYSPVAETVLSAGELREMQHMAREIVVERIVRDYALRIVLATHPDSEMATPQIKRFVRIGASPRGAQAILLSAKIHALLNGRYNVAFDDVDAVLLPALRHRLLLNFEGEAEGATTDALLTGLRESAREAARPQLGI